MDALKKLRVNRGLAICLKSCIKHLPELVTFHFMPFTCFLSSNFNSNDESGSRVAFLLFIRSCLGGLKKLPYMNQ